MLLHQDVLYVSFKHHHVIKTVFSDILGLEGIEHFSLDLVNPDGEMIFFSGTPQHAYEICRRGLGKYDGIISPDYYRNFEFYWWTDAAHKAYANQIRNIREGLLRLKHGFMLVRKWDDFHLIYSFATKQKDSAFQSHVINKINFFLQMGDYAYSKMRELYSYYSGEYEPPIIEKFCPFEGGNPPSRYSKKYNRIHLTNGNGAEQSIRRENNNLIEINFKEKRKIIFP
jgi:hypothetical protein